MSEQKKIPQAVSRSEFLRDLFDEAVRYGYTILETDSSFSFSPIEVLLDSTIDILLLLARSFEEGSSSRRPNQGLGFSETKQDELGNPKQFKISFPSKYYWDPLGKDLFYAMAESFILIKRQKNLRQSFHDFVEFLGFNPTPSKGRTRKKSRANFHWWRRQQRRFRRSGSKEV